MRAKSIRVRVEDRYGYVVRIVGSIVYIAFDVDSTEWDLTVYSYGIDEVVFL